MLDLSNITDEDVVNKLRDELISAHPQSDRWRILGTALNMLKVDSFSKTKTYPRPDHPDKKKRKPLEFLLIGVLVSLRTTLENEQLAMDRILNRCNNIEDVLNLNIKELAGLIKPAGMANQKSKRILGCLHEIQKLDGGLKTLSNKTKNEARDYLLSLPGIGPKAADCILTIGLGFPSMVVDINVFRMASYLFGIELNNTHVFSSERSVEYIKDRLDKAVGDDVFLCQIIHTMLLLAGRRIGKIHSIDKCKGHEYCLTCQRDIEAGVPYPITFL